MKGKRKKKRGGGGIAFFSAKRGKKCVVIGRRVQGMGKVANEGKKRGGREKKGERLCGFVRMASCSCMGQ